MRKLLGVSKSVMGSCCHNPDCRSLLDPDCQDAGDDEHVYHFCNQHCAEAWIRDDPEFRPTSLRIITETCRLHRSILFCPLCKNVLAAPLVITPGYVRPKCRGVPDRQHPEIKMMLMQCVRTQEDLDAESLACD